MNLQKRGFYPTDVHITPHTLLPQLLPPGYIPSEGIRVGVGVIELDIRLDGVFDLRRWSLFEGYCELIGHGVARQGSAIGLY